MKNNENAIREAAYFIWENAGCPAGNDEYFWAQAVEQINGKGKCAAKSSVSSAKKTSSLLKKTSSSFKR